MLVLVLRGRQYLDQLTAFIANQAQDFVVVDWCRHSRLLQQVGEDGAAGFDRVRDRDRKAGDAGVVGEVALRGVRGFEEVEDVAAASEARPVAPSATDEHDRCRRLPPGSLA